MQEPRAYAGMPMGGQQYASAPTALQSRLLLLALPVVVVVLVATGIAWLQWAAQRGVALGYPTPQVHIMSLPSNSLLINHDIQFSADGSGRDLTYTWDFGDQTTASGPSVSHTYQSNGNFTVTVTVTDAIGHTSTDTLAVSAVSPAPTASFTYSVGSSGYVYFDASNSAADPSTSIDSYSWDFGDGGTDFNRYSSQESHYYSSPGTYTVTLIVTDVAGQRSPPYTATVVIS